MPSRSNANDLARRCIPYRAVRFRTRQSAWQLYTGYVTRHTVVFCGTPDAAVPSLRALLADEHFDVRLVVSQPDRPVGRKQVRTPPPVKTAALQAGIPVLQPERMNASLDTLTAAAGGRPDFLVVVAYGQLLSEAALQWPTIAPVNVHFSLLPRWRGAAPVESALLAGDAETGVAVQIMERGLDTGPVLAVERTPIGRQESSVQLRARLADMGAALLRRTLLAPLAPQPQETTGITHCRKLSRDDGRMDAAAHTAEQIDRAVRALVPWPGVTLTLHGKATKVLAVSLEPQPGSVPLACAAGTTLHLVTLQSAGEKPRKADEWYRVATAS